uniref:Gamma 31 kDa subunit of phycoerythrin n=1 Tax=Aglaothamnion neglectum TaxID=2765 RepID=P92928_AGLNE|nr:gamma 31 kDa subunit of phycoerythrin precursor [Aglaothamnion neglectum]
MAAFAPSTALVASTKPATIGATPFATPLANRSAAVKSSAPTMVLRTSLRAPIETFSVYGTYSSIMSKADTYMAQCVKKQYLAMANPMGTFGVQCTEGSVKFAAEVARVRSLSADYRQKMSSPSKAAFDMYENRKAAIVAAHGCHYEEGYFVDYKKVTSTYNTAKSEAAGTCFKYASPETVEEAAMVRYMDITQNNFANPSGVYNMSCNEGSVRGQAEDIRVAALNAQYRQAQKSTNKLMDEKYQQKKAGYAAAHGCTYEEGLISTYAAIGAAFRPKSYHF